jgi:hypothetical protein
VAGATLFKRSSRDRAIQGWLEELFDLAGVPVDEQTGASANER